MTTLNSATKNTDNYDLVPKDHKVMVSYRGVFKSVTSEYLLNWIERFYSSQELHPNIKLKVLFRVSVELIQNLIHHSKNSDSFFFVSRSDNGDTCVVGTSNPVTNDQATILSSTLTTLKKTPQSELRGLKLNVLDQGARSSHGGGGMGLLARRACRHCRCSHWQGEPLGDDGRGGGKPDADEDLLLGLFL